jgi:hypothetical protein
MTVFDDGTGPALYAGGGFTQAGDVSSPYVARWSGSSWSAVPTGMTTPVTALDIFDFGNGPELVAAGQVQQTGGIVALARRRMASDRGCGERSDPGHRRAR